MSNSTLLQFLLLQKSFTSLIHSSGVLLSSPSKWIRAYNRTMLSEKTYLNSLAIVSNSVASKWNDLNTNFLKQAFFTNSFSSVDSFHCQQKWMQWMSTALLEIISVIHSKATHKMQFAELVSVMKESRISTTYCCSFQMQNSMEIEIFQMSKEGTTLK